MADVAPLDALAAEAAGAAPGTYTFGGHTFKLPEKLDLRAIAALQAGNFHRALVLVLGVEQTGELLGLDTPEPFDEDAIAGLFDAYGASQGSNRGESSASSGS